MAKEVQRVFTHPRNMRGAMAGGGTPIAGSRTTEDNDIPPQGVMEPKPTKPRRDAAAEKRQRKAQRAARKKQRN